MLSMLPQELRSGCIEHQGNMPAGGSLQAPFRSACCYSDFKEFNFVLDAISGGNETHVAARLLSRCMDSNGPPWHSSTHCTTRTANQILKCFFTPRHPYPCQSIKQRIEMLHLIPAADFKGEPARVILRSIRDTPQCTTEGAFLFYR